MSKVSVVIPIYNAGNLLNKCIKSLLAQTFQDIEIILINDGSKDESLSICRKYEAMDNRIVVIDKHNEGSIASRRRGIEAAASEYITFVDADDWVDKRLIETLYNETVNNEVDITVCNTYKVLGGFVKRKNKSWYYKEDRIYNKEEIKKDVAVAYLWGHPFPATLHGKIYKRELLISSGKYLNRINFLGDDMFYNLEMLLKANRIKVTDKTLYYYRWGGFTSKYMPHFFDDAVSGYEIQKEVIHEFYKDTMHKEYNGISIMLLNMLKSALYNLFNGKLEEAQIKELIHTYVSNDNIRECLSNEGCKKYFPQDYMNAIRNQDIDYMYHYGLSMYDKQKYRRFFVKVLASI